MPSNHFTNKHNYQMGNLAIKYIFIFSICLVAFSIAEDKTQHIRPPNDETCQRFCYTTCYNSTSYYDFCKDSLNRCKCWKVFHLKNPWVIGALAGSATVVAILVLCCLVVCIVEGNRRMKLHNEEKFQRKTRGSIDPKEPSPPPKRRTSRLPSGTMMEQQLKPPLIQNGLFGHVEI